MCTHGCFVEDRGDAPLLFLPVTSAVVNDYHRRMAAGWAEAREVVRRAVEGLLPKASAEPGSPSVGSSQLPRLALTDHKSRASKPKGPFAQLGALLVRGQRPQEGFRETERGTEIHTQRDRETEREGLEREGETERDSLQ